MPEMTPLDEHTYVWSTVSRLWEHPFLLLLAAAVFSILCAPAFLLFLVGSFIPALAPRTGSRGGSPGRRGRRTLRSAVPRFSPEVSARSASEPIPGAGVSSSGDRCDQRDLAILTQCPILRSAVRS